jgi:hypothetical protein
VVTPVGAGNGIPVDVRFLSATNENIENSVIMGSFRSDLLDRLGEGAVVHLPPLKDRKEDIPLLVEHFVQQAEAIDPKGGVRIVDPETIDLLSSYDWPGNIRQLRSCIMGAINSHPDMKHLVPLHIQLPQDPDTPVAVDKVNFSRPSQNSIKEIIEMLADFDFNAVRPLDLAGKLPDIHRGFAIFLTGYLRACLLATRRPTLDAPEGKLFIHPAMKIMSGNKRLTASKAADLIKRLINQSSENKAELLKDPILSEAYNIALRLRPTSSRKKGRN